jgi:membrane protein insertase Oxa1/YidC/SpoIIIJ
MPLLMAWFSYATASGLAIYFLIGNVVGVIQYAMLGKVNWRNVLPSALLPGARQAAITEKQKSGGRQK